MWTTENRARYDRDKLRYPSDLADEEWAHIEALIWLGRCRRLAKDFENLTRNALAFIRLASIRLMLRRICRNS
jgi:hypothetical protein